MACVMGSFVQINERYLPISRLQNAGVARCVRKFGENF